MPSPARVCDHVLGGKDDYEADRRAAEHAMRVFPEGRDLAWANRRFMRRAVTHCARHVAQIVDLGTGIPTPPDVGAVARRVRPDAVVAASATTRSCSPTTGAAPSTSWRATCAIRPRPYPPSTARWSGRGRRRRSP
ncbi:SAM-dependent methyltransferase [Nonomuraea sp. NPDC059007]|uniref:SAM-dependent methyltransferase n=1 Tax=Nonomuraea sp. NPDC059007 TaxID=3346692 RepID=UPI003686D2AC